jgi:serine/threonine-protein kinase
MNELDNDESPPEGVPAGTVVAGRYKVERRLGAGGMGEVYLVQHVHTDERFAMKVLLSTVISDQTALERFRREARTPARIDSEHVVRVTDADVARELKDAPFLVMEYLRGEDLDHYLERHGAMSGRDVVMFLRQAARALDKAHALGIVHRDLKPENIFITYREDGTPHVKILDFGIAKFTSGATSDLINKTATSPGQIYGTPLYMSPEQAKGESNKVSPQTDIWALGLIANRMLAGRDYWDAETLTALIAQVVYEPMRKPSEKGFDFGPKYDEWFVRCCNREPDARFSTAGEAVFRLGQALGVIEADAVYTLGGPASLQAMGPVSGRGSLASSPLNLAPKPLSRTELQLAQTGAAPPSRAPADRGPFVKVAVGAAIIGAAVAVLVYGLGQRPNVERTAANPSVEVRPQGTHRTWPPAGGSSVTPAPTVAPVPTSSSEVEPAASSEPAVPLADPSANPSTSASAPASPKLSPKPPKPKDTGSPKDPPPKPDQPKTKPDNPLDTRT